MFEKTINIWKKRYENLFRQIYNQEHNECNDDYYKDNLNHEYFQWISFVSFQ